MKIATYEKSLSLTMKNILMCNSYRSDSVPNLNKFREKPGVIVQQDVNLVYFISISCPKQELMYRFDGCKTRVQSKTHLWGQLPENYITLNPYNF